MSLPPLLKHVYNFGTEEVVKRGKKIFFTQGVTLLDVDAIIEQVRFRVKNDMYQNFYTVTISRYNHPDELKVRCQCPYNMGEICRHEVAALFQMNDLMLSGFFENTQTKFNQAHSVVRMRQVTKQMMRLFTSEQIMRSAEEIAHKKQCDISIKEGDTLAANVQVNGQVFPVVLKQNEERFFDTSCPCEEVDHPLCVHKAALFMQVLFTHGTQYFASMRNWDSQKNLLLKQYGYSLNDDLTGKFEFVHQDGKIFLRVLDTSIQKIVVQTNSVSKSNLAVSAIQNQIAPKADKVKQEVEEKRLAIVIDPNVDWFPGVSWDLIAGVCNESLTAFISEIERMPLIQYINAAGYHEHDRELIPALRKLLPDELLKYIKKNIPFGDFMDDDYRTVLKDQPSDEIKTLVWEYLLPKYHKLLERFASQPRCYLLPNGKTLSKKNLTEVLFDPQLIKPRLKVAKVKKEYHISLYVDIGLEEIPATAINFINNALFTYQGRLFSMIDEQAIRILDTLEYNPVTKISEENWNSFLADQLIPWSGFTPVDFDKKLVAVATDLKPICKILLIEKDQSLHFKPVFDYNSTVVEWGHKGDIIHAQEGIVTIVKKQEDLELSTVALVRAAHKDIQEHAKQHYFYLSSQAVLNNSWFLKFAEKMRDKDIELLGFDKLKNLRINKNSPDTRVQINSGIDWFDAQIEVVFGDQVASIADVKKALAKKMNYVKLNDGSIGMLPEEWLKKYALLVKMGEAKGNKIRVKKIYFSVLDELLEDIDDVAILKELELKKQKIQSILTQDFNTFEAPKQLEASLRPYQLSGFQWLLFLNEAGWGGILADDMGLGKTVQTLSFLQHYKNTNATSKYLVVCPTTLMYNWESEIKKFTPNLSLFIHHGSKRNINIEKLKDIDIIITTYGTMRSDIIHLKEIAFDYIILDESQAIKNPQSQIAKASLLLNAKNRLALSGTPVQNNTFDLYSQMNFLNPGMLGSREFFLNEFATPIDKFQEDEAKLQLRKLIYPFLLRRTKEQVAKDLPDKTETILWCEMGKDQRKIYESYRNTYKEELLEVIEERGIERSQMHILQGLTKLRQICDSPAILNEDVAFDNSSIKVEELVRELSENVGNHKALVFSQFIGMLSLIKKELDKANIPYAYFDGSSTSTERQKAINLFQEQEDCRVFLISLKAGNTGLNLTAADYVYIVDPWWNPAVEQQAIDRTHRIGQTKNIFAYRLICKNTIEEKMIQLQERKRALANDLVADDGAIIKRLTKDDLLFLLS